MTTATQSNKTALDFANQKGNKAIADILASSEKH